MKKLLLLLVSFFTTVALLPAADQLREVQSELKTQGFFFGDLNGEDGPETVAALKRYQIRNGLPVTGKVDADTLKALGIGASKPESPSSTEPLPPTSDNHPPQVNPPPPVPQAPSEPPGPTNPPPSAHAPPVPPGPGATKDQYTNFFKGTPYATAPREVQVDTVRRAQGSLANKGLYSGPASGIPSIATTTALMGYQTTHLLQRTGRLDLPTLSELKLLPKVQSAPPVPLKPFRR